MDVIKMVLKCIKTLLKKGIALKNLDERAQKHNEMYYSTTLRRIQ